MTDPRTDLPAHSSPGYRTIVVCCNGSTQADDAVALAQQLLGPEHARLVLANVFPFHRGCELSATPSMYATVLQSEAVATLEAASARIDARISRALVPVTVLDPAGDAADREAVPPGRKVGRLLAEIAVRQFQQHVLPQRGKPRSRSGDRSRGPRSALLHDGVDDTLGDVDDGLAELRAAPVELAACDALVAVLDSEQVGHARVVGMLEPPLQS